MTDSDSGPRFLMVFDFDHTIVDANTDVEVQSLEHFSPIPPEVKSACRTQGWTKYMQRVFDFHHEQGVRKEHYMACMDSIPMTPGFTELVRDCLPQMGAEVIIISDSNSQFIGRILAERQLEHYFRKVFTNPARFDEREKLHVEPFHHQTSCDLSNVNLCKGQVLSEYLAQRAAEGVTFPFVAYAGDGANDFCPIFKVLKKDRDIAFARSGEKYAIENHMKRMEESRGLNVEAKVVFWTHGDQITSELEHRFKDNAS